MPNPTYENHSGHQEVVKVSFDPNVISYKDLLQEYWINIDPFDGDGQFCDRGDSYKPIIFTSNEFQFNEANRSFEKASRELGVAKKALKLEIRPYTEFWLAEN